MEYERKDADAEEGCVRIITDERCSETTSINLRCHGSKNNLIRRLNVHSCQSREDCISSCRQSTTIDEMCYEAKECVDFMSQFHAFLNLSLNRLILDMGIEMLDHRTRERVSIVTPLLDL